MTYDPTHMGAKNETAEYIRGLQKKSQVEKGFIRPEMVQVGIVKLPYMEEDQFGIQMSVPDVVSGCYTFSPLEYEANFVDPYFLDIKVKKYRRIAPEGSNTKCDNQNKMSTAMMVLSKKDLQSRGTKEIRFSTEVATDTYKIILDEQQLQLVPSSMVVFKGQNLGGPLKDRLVHSFASNKIVVLHVPMAQPGENLTGQILQFAQSHALSPASPGNIATWGGNGLATYYFYDNNGDTLSRIGEDGYAEVGQIKANRPYDGIGGRQATSVDLSIFAARPGTEL